MEVDWGDWLRSQDPGEAEVTRRPKLRRSAIDKLRGVDTVQLSVILDHGLLLSPAPGDVLKDALVRQLHLVGNAEKCLQLDIKFGKQQGIEVMLTSKLSEGLWRVSDHRWLGNGRCVH